MLYLRFAPFCCCFFLCLVARAEATSPDVGDEKYIVYWGKMQCELSESTGFMGRVSAPPQQFRSALFMPPKIWRAGHGVTNSPAFVFEKVEVEADAYYPSLEILDRNFGQKAAKGDQFRMSLPDLGGGHIGSIVFEITDDLPPQNRRDLATQLRAVVGNYDVLTDVQWGEHVNLFSQREFYTPTECRQTLMVMPDIMRGAQYEHESITAKISIDLDFTQLEFGYRHGDWADFQRFQEQIKYYQYLLTPGATVFVSLLTDQQYARGFSAKMRLVADDDRRLQFVHKRIVSFEWGPLTVDKIPMYLHSWTDPDGQKVHADAPMTFNFWVNLDVFKEKIDALARQTPIVKVDDQNIRTLRCQATVNDKAFVLQHDQPVPAELIEWLRQLTDKSEGITIAIDALETSDNNFDLSPLTLYFNGRMPPRF